MRFQDFPEAGMKTITSIDWDPDVRVRVKATCWYVEEGQVIIPALQPRKTALSEEKLGIYRRLIRQAYCQGDWVDARDQIIDLSGDGESVVARILRIEDIPLATDRLAARYVKTFVEAKRTADKFRAAKPKKKAEVPMAALLGIED